MWGSLFSSLLALQYALPQPSSQKGLPFWRVQCCLSMPGDAQGECTEAWAPAAATEHLLQCERCLSTTLFAGKKGKIQRPPPPQVPKNHSADMDHMVKKVIYIYIFSLAYNSLRTGWLGLPTLSTMVPSVCFCSLLPVCSS